MEIALSVSPRHRHDRRRHHPADSGICLWAVTPGCDSRWCLPGISSLTSHPSGELRFIGLRSLASSVWGTSPHRS